MKELLHTADRLNPTHKLGASLLNSQELAGNREMGQRAQKRSMVHHLEPGVRESYGGRKGRRPKVR